MVDRPDSLPEVATATNYSTGPHVGLPTKLAPETVDIEQGNIATVHPNARKFNWWQNLVYKWLSYFDNQIRRGVEADPNGVHSAERGCLYTSQTDNSWWKNIDGDDAWERVYLVPDPSAEDDGVVLQVASGAAVWGAGSGVSKYLTAEGVITAGVGVATFDATAQLALYPSTCAIACTVLAALEISPEGGETHSAFFPMRIIKSAGAITSVLVANGVQGAADVLTHTVNSMGTDDSSAGSSGNNPYSGAPNGSPNATFTLTRTNASTNPDVLGITFEVYFGPSCVITDP